MDVIGYHYLCKIDHLWSYHHSWSLRDRFHAPSSSVTADHSTMCYQIVKVAHKPIEAQQPPEF